MTPVSADVSKELIELHKKVEEAGCKAIAFVDPDVFVIAAQAKNISANPKLLIRRNIFGQKRKH